MPARTLALLVTLLVCPLAPARAGTGGGIRGRVIVVDHGKPVARLEVPAFVYLEPVDARQRPAGTAPPAREIRQVGKQFAPHVLVVPVGTKIAFPNYDREEHNVFSPTEIEVFDLGRYNTDKRGKTHTFEGPGEIEIYCDIHREMWARVKVVESAYIAEVKDGAFAFTAIPAGSYKVHAWYPNSTESRDTVVVTEGATVTTRELHVQIKAIPPHLRKDGTDYCHGGGQYCPD